MDGSYDGGSSSSGSYWNRREVWNVAASVAANSRWPVQRLSYSNLLPTAAGLVVGVTSEATNEHVSSSFVAMISGDLVTGSGSENTRVIPLARQTTADRPPLKGAVKHIKLLANDTLVYSLDCRIGFCHLPTIVNFPGGPTSALSPPIHINSIAGMDVHPHSGLILTGGDDSHIHIMAFDRDLVSVPTLITSKNVGSRLTSVKWCANGPSLASWTTASNHFQILDTRSNEVSMTIQAKPGMGAPLTSHDYFSNQMDLCLGHEGGSMEIIDLRLGQAWCTIQDTSLNHVSSVVCLPSASSSLRWISQGATSTSTQGPGSRGKSFDGETFTTGGASLWSAPSSKYGTLPALPAPVSVYRGGLGLDPGCPLLPLRELWGMSTDGVLVALTPTSQGQ